MAIPLLEQLQAETPASTQLSEELQFIGTALDDRLNFTTGIYLFSDKTVDDTQYSVTGPFEVIPGSLLNPQIGGLPAVLNLTARRDTDADNEAYAWFTQTDFDITSQTELTLGLRWTKEIRRTSLFRETGAYQSFVNAGAGTSVFGQAGSPVAVVVPGAGGYTLVDDPTLLDYANVVSDVTGVYRDNAWTPMASISYLLADDLLDPLQLDSAMLFVTFSEGFRSGGLVEAAGINDQLDEFDSETVRNYEFGIKLDALDKKLRANLAMFYTEYEDMQLTTVITDADGRPGSRLDNAGKAIISGAELELEWLFLQSWRAMLSTSYIDADLKEFEDEYAGASIADQVACSVKGNNVAAGTRVAAPQNAPCSSLNGNGLTYVPVISRADEAMPRSPRKQAYFALEYMWNTSAGTIIPHIDMSYRSEVYHHFDRDSWTSDGWIAPPQTFYNARITWVMPDDRLSVALWVQNLRDTDDYLIGGVPLVGFSGAGGQVYADPRMYGLEAHMRF
jgi:iron complex outermembrane receptor protein